MDYPQLNLLFGLGLILALVINIGLRVLLSKLGVSVWLSRLSWLALLLSILSALYIETLFLRSTTPAFNWQILLGLLVIGGIGALITASLYQRVQSPGFAGILFAVQMIITLLGLGIAFVLYRSLVPVPAGS
jgi:hypothetical protein